MRGKNGALLFNLPGSFFLLSILLRGELLRAGHGVYIYLIQHDSAKGNYLSYHVRSEPIVA
jgi:hypothetical protein